MRVIALFDKYFLALMIIQGFILVIDSKGFLKCDMKIVATKAKALGVGIIATGIVLFLITKYIA